MNQRYRIPKNDFEAIEYFDSYEDDNLAVEMIEFYQEQRGRNIPLEKAYLETLENCETLPNSVKSVPFNIGNQITLQYAF